MARTTTRFDLARPPATAVVDVPPDACCGAADGTGARSGAPAANGRGARLVAGRAAAGVAVVLRGARILRVHDVTATVDALRVWDAAGPADGDTAR